MKIHVTIKEMVIDDNIKMSVNEANTLNEYSVELSIVREQLGKPVRVSKRSGLRTVEYEKSKGRTGTSQHSTFEQGQGAIDLIYDKELFDKLVERKFFTRICYYPNNGFIHCDKKPTNKKGIEYFEASTPTAAWVFKKLLS